MTSRKITLAGAAALALMTAAVGPVAAQQRVITHRSSTSVRVVEPAPIVAPAPYQPVAVIVGVDY